MWRRTGGSLSGWIVFGGSLLFYVGSLAPGIENWDTGELQTDANALFIAHPTGFPLFVLGGWTFAHVFTFGDPAWRISLFSAIAVSLAAAMLATFVYELTRDVVASTAAGLAFAPIGVVWMTAVRADAHDLALGCTAVALAFALRSSRTRALADVRVAALAWGAALATHPVALFAGPALALLAWPAFATASARERAMLVVWCAAPLLAYAYVPLRSIAIERAGLDPNVALGLRGTALVDDGAPSTPASFARYLLATRFAPADSFSRFATGAGIAHARAFAYDLVYGAFGYLTLALAIVGAGALARRSWRVALALALLAAGGIAFAANYAIESEPYRYTLAALWAFAAYAGYGAWWFANAVVQRVKLASIVAASLLAAGLVPTYARAQHVVVARALRDDQRAEAARIVAHTADGSVIVASWAYATPLAYAKYVTRTLGSRRIVSGWPAEYRTSFPTWRRAFGHVYAVVDGGAPATPGVTKYVAPEATYRLVEVAGS